jgi:CheY-like chemotaxis protein
MIALPSQQTHVKLRILVVDDNLDNAWLLQTLLEAEGYCVEVADSGQAALQQMRIAPPDLVLLDVMMPEMDGFKVVRKIRGDRRLRATPIVLITAYDEPFVEYGWKLGADDFIRKPIEHDKLLQRIRASCPQPS